MIKIIIYITVFFLGGVSLSVQAAPSSSAPLAQTAKTEFTSSIAPTRQVKLFFKTLNKQQGSFTLNNFTSGGMIEFAVRHDELIEQAILHLQFTPSPALIPLQSQIKIYLNDELIKVLALSAEQMGKRNSVDIPIDPLYISDFNRLKLEVIGHYNALCENPAHSSIWVNVDQLSYLEMNTQTLLLKNDLMPFPEPFFDALDNRIVTLPVVFGQEPSLLQQKAAAVLASWFGSKALWRGVSFEVLYNSLPTRHALVFATNQHRPDFLKDYKTVQAPTVEIINHPNNPYIKLLLILGRDEQDLLTAVQGIAQGNVLFRGQSVIVDKVKPLKPRKPYDAPNWISTTKPVSFSQLQEFNEQLSTKGFNPYPISLRFNLPPDLFLNQTRGVELNLKYRYSLPPVASISHLNIVLNNYFIKSYELEAREEGNSNFNAQNLAETSRKMFIPVMELGANNEFNFLFEYGTQITGGMHDGQCITYNIINNYGVIDGASTINFANYFHYITMPNLNVFMSAGFPFSRMADLSQTTVLVNPNASAQAVASLLNVIGNIGAKTGLPALGLTLKEDWSQVRNQDKDLIIIGSFPDELQHNENLNVLLTKTQEWIKVPLSQNTVPGSQMIRPITAAETKTTVNATGAIAAIMGMQSPYYKERSIILLLAGDEPSFKVLNKALTNPSSIPEIFGSVAVIRNADIHSLRVGTTYQLGYIPWWNYFWSLMHKHPINLAIISLLAAILVTFLIWNGLSVISRRRLKGAQEDKSD